MSEKPTYAKLEQRVRELEAREVKRRLRAKDDLEYERRLTQQYLDVATVILVALDKHQNVVLINPHGCEVLGYPREEILGRNWFDMFLPPELVPEVKGVFEQIVAGAPAPVEYFENVIRRADGSERLIAWHNSVLRDSAGEISGLFSSGEDITERKLTEEALRQSEERFATAMEATHDGLYDWNLVTNEIYYSPSWKGMLGYADDELDNDFSVWEQLTHPTDVKRSWTLLQEHLAGKTERFELEFRMRHKRGHWVDVLSRATAVRDENAKPVRVVGTHIDISAKKRDAEETMALEAQLHQAQKMEAIATLAGGIAHDFNNRLAIVEGNVTYVLDRPALDPDTRDALVDVREATDRAQSLTQQLLTFARGGDPIKQASSLAELISDATNLTLPGSSARCRLELAPDLWPVNVDQGQLVQALGNLLMNATQAMPEGGYIDIRADNCEVTASAASPGGQDVRLIITDQGTGISEDDLPRVFDPFFTTKQQASGLGLSTSYSIIDRHEGRITIESTVGEGTSVTILLPAVSPVDTSLDPGTGRGLDDTVRILLMDDEPAIRTMSARILSALGYEPTTAADGEDAVVAYQRAYDEGRPFALVILDLTVPGGMGGDKAMRELLRINPGVTAVVSSGYSNDPVMAKYTEHGFRGVIPKPYSKRQLETLLNELVPRKLPGA